MKQMTLEEISKAAASGAFRKIPVSREIYSDIRTPVETLKVLQGVSSHCYMLESVEDKKQWGRYTFLGYDPSLELTCVNGNLTITADAAEMKKSRRYSGKPRRTASDRTDPADCKDSPSGSRHQNPD